MKYKIFLLMLLLSSLLFLLCAGENASMYRQSDKLEDPIDDSSILIMGCLFVENMGIDEQYESIEKGNEIVLVGRYEVDGQQVVNGYHLKTDDNGYYFLPNVPKGSYVIKGARIYVANSFEINIISNWRTNEVSYYVPYLQEGLIRHDVKYFPSPPKGRIYDFGITLFGIYKGSEESGPQGMANNVLYQSFRSISNQKFHIGRKYTKPSPKEYFKEKYPDSKWFTVVDKLSGN